MTASTYSTTTDRPALLGTRHQIDRMIADAAHRIQLAAACPPIDCEDLYIAFVFDADAAYAQLATLGPKGFVAQAISMTGYMNELLGVNWPAESIIARWTSALERRGLKATVA